MKRLSIVILAAVVTTGTVWANEPATALKESSVNGGLVVHLGCGDGAVTATLRISDATTVQGLDRDPANVHQAREYIQSKELYGPVSVDHLRGSVLPYVDNLVRALVVSDSEAISHDELMRVVCPGGVVIIDGKLIVKPWPEEMAQWPQHYNTPDNNAVALDSAVGPPRHFLHDVVFVGHELGHNFNGIHTHCFNPPVDQCATESGCNQTQDCSTAPGTIMSYCDNCAGGLSNIILGFAPENVARIRTEIDSSCLVPTRNPIYVDWRNFGTEDGTSAHPYDTVIEGVWYVHPSGMVVIADGVYVERMTIFQPMTLTATGGSAVIGFP